MTITRKEFEKGKKESLTLKGKIKNLLESNPNEAFTIQEICESLDLDSSYPLQIMTIEDTVIALEKEIPLECRKVKIKDSCKLHWIIKK